MKMRWGPLVPVFGLQLHHHYKTESYRVMLEENCEKLFCDVVITKRVFHGKVELVPTNISGEGPKFAQRKQEWIFL